MAYYCTVLAYGERAAISLLCYLHNTVHQYSYDVCRHYYCLVFGLPSSWPWPVFLFSVQRIVNIVRQSRKLSRKRRFGIEVGVHNGQRRFPIEWPFFTCSSHLLLSSLSCQNRQWSRRALYSIEVKLRYNNVKTAAVDQGGVV